MVERSMFRYLPPLPGSKLAVLARGYDPFRVKTSSRTIVLSTLNGNCQWWASRVPPHHLL